MRKFYKFNERFSCEGEWTFALADIPSEDLLIIESAIRKYVDVTTEDADASAELVARLMENLAT